MLNQGENLPSTELLWSLWPELNDIIKNLYQYPSTDLEQKDNVLVLHHFIYLNLQCGTPCSLFRHWELLHKRWTLTFSRHHKLHTVTQRWNQHLLCPPVSQHSGVTTTTNLKNLIFVVYFDILPVTQAKVHCATLFHRQQSGIPSIYKLTWWCCSSRQLRFKYFSSVLKDHGTLATERLHFVGFRSENWF